METTWHIDTMHTGRNIAPQATGERNFKITSPYVVVSDHGYTKHYYAGTERLAARIGGGFGKPILSEQPQVSQQAKKLFEQCQKETEKRVLEAIPPHTIRRDHLSENIYIAMMREFEIPMHLMANAVIKSNNLLSTAQNIVSGSAEPDVYFYHSDHLGSASWITDASGNPVQHLQYLPYGEPFVNQRVSGYNERFTFTGKERDEETGYSYFSARYLDHEILTSFLSVDRYAHKYPSISPYAYCAWNPIRLIDPSGDSVVLEGDAKLINYAVGDMQNRTKNLQLSVNEKGSVSYSGKPVTEDEVYMAEIINNKQIKVNMFLQKDSKIRDNLEMLEGACDAFDGSDVYKDTKGNLKANAFQYVNVIAMRSLDPSKSGDLIWHAVSEAFEGAHMALELRHSVRYNDPDYLWVYNISHNNANLRFCGNISGFGFNPEKMVYTIDRF